MAPVHTVSSMQPAMPVAVGGFKTIVLPERRRLVVSIAGLEKSGKTHFALTAPGPIAYASLDIGGLEGVIDKFASKRVLVAEYRVVVPPGADEKQIAESANAVWRKYKEDIAAAVASPSIRSIVIDPESDTWELIRLARFGKLTQVLPHHYGPVNNEYRDLLRSVFMSDKNLILLGKLKDEWENYKDSAGKEKGRKTGRLERKGQSDVPFIVQVNAITRYSIGDGFQIEIQSCRQNPELNGLQIPGVGFAELAQMIYPDSDESAWM